MPTSVYMGLEKHLKEEQKKTHTRKTMNISVVITVVVHFILPLFPTPCLKKNANFVCFVF